MKTLDMIGSDAIALPIQVSTFGWVQGSGVSAVRMNTRGGFATLGYTGRLRGSGDAHTPGSVDPGTLS
ncbi:hypothetical protein [Cellulomonas sp. RIT-PI-Y]|uniref:hypothetical protein n=1 Tax=Cellulomonas sp. RIT-PI-Y TaxID=3035297 RepID=UPI0021D7DB39|nr:hypothetical protein [Cellulomonas sp. RIT-PI-Y]